MRIARRLFAFGMLAIAPAIAVADDKPKPKAPANAVVVLEKVWPGHPESLAMR